MSTASFALIGPIGSQEMILIFILILLLFGAKKLPEFARGVGKSMGEFKKAREEFEHEITRSEAETRVKDAARAPIQDSRPAASEVAYQPPVTPSSVPVTPDHAHPTREHQETNS